MFDNKFVDKYPNINLTPGFMSTTDHDGTFRVVTIPGPVLLMGGVGVANIYKRPVTDPKYPQYFHQKLGAGHPTYVGYSSNMIGLIPGNYCKVLEIKDDAQVVTQDILLEPVD